MELELHLLLLISAKVPHQCTIRAKHLGPLGFKMLVPTAIINSALHIHCEELIFLVLTFFAIALPIHFYPNSLFLLQSPTLFPAIPASTRTPACAARSLLSVTSQPLTPSASATIESVLPTCHHPTHSASACMGQTLCDQSLLNRLSFSIINLSLRPTSCYLP